MSVVVLLLCAGLVSQVNSAPHRAFRSIASGLITGFAGLKATVPAACFNLGTTRYLEDALIEALSFYIRGSDDFYLSFTHFTNAAKSAVHECDFESHLQTIAAWNSSSELAKLWVNVGWQTDDDFQLLSSAMDSAASFQWQEFGSALGQYVKSVTRRSLSARVVNPNSLLFLKGAKLGLAKKQVESHACYDQFLRISRFFAPFLDSVFVYATEEDSSRLDSVLEILEEYSDELALRCRFAELSELILTKVADGDFIYFIERIFENRRDITRNVHEAGLMCEVGMWEECGRRWGKAAKLVLGWEI